MQNKDSYFTPEQWSVINGSLLGDGYINKPKRGQSALSKVQCQAHFMYLEWHKEFFGNKCCEIKKYLNRAAGKTYVRHQLRWKANPLFSELRTKWYPNGKKIVPCDLNLDLLTIAIWFFDDGSNNLRSRNAVFATYCFSKQEVDFLCGQLKDKFLIKTTIGKDNTIRVKTESYKMFVDLIKPYMLWPCFQHKVAYRDSQLKYTTDDEAITMIDMYSQGIKLSSIAEQFGCSCSVVSNIVRGVRKRHLNQKQQEVALNNKSGHTGVCFDRDRQRWLATIRINGKNKKIGRFSTLEAAVEARNCFKQENDKG